MDELFHECGVAAVYHRQVEGGQVSRLAPIAGDPLSVTRLVPRMLLDMQNRGQLASGMTSYNPDRKAILATHKELGTVAEGFRLNLKEKFEKIMRGQDGHRAGSATSAMPPVARMTRAMPSRSSASTAGKPSGLPSPSMVRSPIIKL